MKILITGANGYLGRGIVKKFLDNNFEVIATDYTTDLVDSRAVRKNADLFEINNPFDYFGQPDVVLHLAWKDGFVHNSFNHLTELPKHIVFIEKLLKKGLKRICIMGSMHEVGFYEGSIDENTKCNPQNYYGISKNALRNVMDVLKTNYDFKFQWLRAFYIVGNSTLGSSVFSKLSAAELDNKKKFPFTLGENQYDFLDYEDFCNQVFEAVSQEEILGIINICSGKPEKLCHRVERYIKDNNYKIKLEYGVFPDRPYDSKAIWGNNQKILKIMTNEYKVKVI